MQRAVRSGPSAHGLVSEVCASWTSVLKVQSGSSCGSLVPSSEWPSRLNTDMNTASQDLRLIEPRVDLEQSHASFLTEFRERGEPVVPWIVDEPFERFADYVAMLEAAAEGRGIPSNFVPHSTFWLVDAKDEIVAISNLRHELNDFLLSYGGHIGFGVQPSVRRQGHATEVLRQTLVRVR